MLHWCVCPWTCVALLVDGTLCDSCWAHDASSHGTAAQGASGAGLRKVGHVAWLRLLLPDEPPTTLVVKMLASCLVLGCPMLTRLLIWSVLYGMRSAAA